MINRKLITLIAVLLVALGLTTLAACSGGAQASQIARATRINADILDETVSIQMSEVQKNVMSNFSVATTSNEISFMAYEFGGQIYVRADICPPCRSESFSLVKDTLVCDTCGTVFDAKTSRGIKGACVRYPKALVPYEVNNGKIIMKGADLIKAFQDTLEQG